MFMFLADEKTKVSGLNSSKHYPNSVSEFLPESNFDLLMIFTGAEIWLT
jgi:hypothetical protein